LGEISSSVAVAIVTDVAISHLDEGQAVLVL
jgi:hypothetical protein